MRKMILVWVTMFNMVAVMYWATVSAQMPLPWPAQPIIITQADIQHMLKVNNRDTSMGSVEAGKHVVDVWLDQRESRPNGSPNAEMHSDLTEIYVVQKGSGTQRMGGKMLAPKLNEVLPTQTMPGGATFQPPTYSGQQEGGQTFDLNVGDIVVLPPGTVHQWVKIPTEMRYIIMRIDPEHRQKAGFVQPLLKR